VFADVLHAAIDEGKGGSVHETVNERSVRVLKNLLNSARDGRRLSPVVILHRDYENPLDFPGIPVFLGACTPTAGCGEECEHTERADISEQGHGTSKSMICGRCWSASQVILQATRKTRQPLRQT
jgi:hypothetical protein